MSVGKAGARGTRLHKLDTLARLPADGAPRRATEADAQLAAEWVVVEFSELGEVSGEWTRAQVRDGCLWFWERDGVPVSMVGHHLPVFGVTRRGGLPAGRRLRRLHLRLMSTTTAWLDVRPTVAVS